MFLGGAWVASPEARSLRDLVEATRKRMDRERKVFCAQAGLTEQQYCDQMALRAPFNLWRLADVPGFFRAFLEVLAEQEACVVYPKAMVSLIVKVHETPRPMLSAHLPYEQDERKRA